MHIRVSRGYSSYLIWLERVLMDPACRIPVASAQRVALLVARLCARARGLVCI